MFDSVIILLDSKIILLISVKPGDDERVLPDIKLSDLSTFKMPNTFSEFVELSTDTGRAIVSLVGSLSERTWEFVTDKKEVYRIIYIYKLIFKYIFLIKNIS